MSAADWQNLAITVLGVFGLATVSRLVKRRWNPPEISPWLVLGPFNVIWAVLFILGMKFQWPLPTFVMPVALVGGNAALANLFGLPVFSRRAARKRRSGSASDPDREKIIPRSRKKKRQKRRR